MKGRGTHSLMLTPVHELVFAPRKRKEVDGGEPSHLDAHQHPWYSDLDIRITQLLARFNGPPCDQEVDDLTLPKAQEDDKFDTEQLQKRIVRREILLELDVELDEAQHGDGDGDAFDNEDPEVGEVRRQGGIAVEACHLGEDGHDGAGDANETVLEDTEPDDLQ